MARAPEEPRSERLREITFRYTVSDRAPRQREFPIGWRRQEWQHVRHVRVRQLRRDDHQRQNQATASRPSGPSPRWPSRCNRTRAVPSRAAVLPGPRIGGEFATAAVEVRNTAATSVGPGYLWTARRTYPLLGETLPERQVSDLLAAVALLRQEPVTGPVAVYGQGYTAPLAIYAALLDPQITEIVLADCPTSHEDPQTPEFLGVLRIGDLPHNLALAYPRTITFVGKMPEAYKWTQQLYEKLGAGDRIRVIRSVASWQPQ